MPDNGVRCVFVLPGLIYRSAFKKIRSAGRLLLFFFGDFIGQMQNKMADTKTNAVCFEDVKWMLLALQLMVIIHITL